MENRNFYIISILILLLIGLFMIPISGLLIDPASEPNYLDTPMEELNGYSLRQVYENDLYVDDDLSFLNNHTLREVFENGNLIVNNDFSTTNNWNVFNSSNAIFENTLINSGYGSDVPRTWADITEVIISGENYYFNIKIQPVTSTPTNVRFSTSNGLTEIQVIDEFIPIHPNVYTKSYNFTSNSNADNVILLHFYDEYAIKFFRIYQVYLVNRTSFGITSLTVTQIDYFLNLYQGILASAVFGNYINEYGIYANGSYIQDMTTFGLENMSLAKHNYYYDLYQYYSSFEN